jgi:hypothetical protein
MLDLAFSVAPNDTLSWVTFRKELNAYLYVPKSSAHPESTFNSIISSEFSRMNLTNKSISSMHENVSYFARKFERRGHYDCRAKLALLAKRTVSRRLQGIVTAPRVKVRKHMLVLRYSSSVNSFPIRKILKSYSKFASIALRRPVCIGLAYKLQPNNFRRHYGETWRRYSALAS